MICKNCQSTVLCKSCIDDMIADKACPICRNGKSEFIEINKPLKRLLYQLQIMCGNQTNCPKAGQSMSYEELVTKHAEICLEKTMDCPLKCGKILSNR